VLLSAIFVVKGALWTNPLPTPAGTAHRQGLRELLPRLRCTAL